MSKTYRYEMHCHTAEGSRCSQLDAHGMVDYYISKGYDGIIITDHFTGSTTVPKDTPWEERIEMFYENGFSIAQRYGAEKGLKVFFGLEWSTKGNDFVIIGPDKDWWIAQKDFFELSPNQVFDRVHEAGAFVTHAHPFAEARWIECIRLFPRKVDAVEVFNGGNPPLINKRAVDYARSYGLPMVGGTDTHTNTEKNMCGIEVPYECNSLADIIEAIRKGDAKAISETQMGLLDGSLEV